MLHGVKGLLSQMLGQNRSVTVFPPSTTLGFSPGSPSLVVGPADIPSSTLGFDM